MYVKIQFSSNLTKNDEKDGDSLVDTRSLYSPVRAMASLQLVVQETHQLDQYTTQSQREGEGREEEGEAEGSRGWRKENGKRREEEKQKGKQEG